MPLPRALEIADVVAASPDNIPAQLHKPPDKKGCCSAVVEVNVVAKLAVQLAVLREIGLVAEARVESRLVRIPLPHRLGRGRSGNHSPTEEPPSRISGKSR